MRVIAGKFKGRILKAPRGSRIRPSSQMVKEALFCILGRGICDASFLELFAGSGSIGIEAKSRGAKKVFLVERNKACIKTIEENLRQLGILYSYALKINSYERRKEEKEEDVVLLPFDAERATRILYRRKEKVDFVFLDPPYYGDELKNSLIKICRYDILKPHTLVIAEHNKRQVLPYLLAGLRIRFSKRYGDTVLSFYEKEEKV